MYDEQVKAIKQQVPTGRVVAASQSDVVAAVHRVKPKEEGQSSVDDCANSSTAEPKCTPQPSASERFANKLKGQARGAEGTAQGKGSQRPRVRVLWDFARLKTRMRSVGRSEDCPSVYYFLL